MARLIWDTVGEREYFTGVDHGVLFPRNGASYKKGVAWNGLSGVNETHSGGEASPVYANNIKYLNLMTEEEKNLNISAYTYPEEFEECDGSKEVCPGVLLTQQERIHFGFVYRSYKANDTEGTDHGYLLHILFDCVASPTDQDHQTINETVDISPMSWDVSTTKVEVTGYKPTAEIVIDSTRTDKDKLAALEDKLFGKDGTGEAQTGATDPTFLSPAEIIALVGATS